MRRLVRVLLATAIGAPIAVSTPGRAIACRCRDLEPRQLIHRADAIVAGHVVQVTPIDPFRSMSVLAIDGVYEGKVGSQVLLTADMAAGDCATVFYPVGSTVDPLVLARRPDGAYVVDPCALAMLPQITALLGEPRPPPEGPPIATIAPSASNVALPPPIASAPPSSRVSWPAVGGGVLMALALIAFAVWRSGRVPAEEASAAEPGDGAEADEDGPTSGPSG